ncbi:MAG: LysM peptidoglycan-binding domain-containing protein [Chloroflexi bacterium]|nr:LysM peptidoglycan-binding domain-containing protein [Chloroflexota bacterium]
MQRFSNHLILLALVGLFVLGVQVLGAGEETAVNDPLEVLVEAPLPVANGGTTAAVSESAAVPILPTIDLTRVPILSDNSLAPELDPITFVGKKPVHDFPTYVVEAGDAPENIATRFGISTETILGGNPRLSNEASALQTGTELVILPIDGVLHTVERGETLESISTRYGISTEEIIAYADNNLEFPYRLYPRHNCSFPAHCPRLASCGTHPRWPLFGATIRLILVVATATSWYRARGRMCGRFRRGTSPKGIGWGIRG